MQREPGIATVAECVIRPQWDRSIIDPSQIVTTMMKQSIRSVAAFLCLALVVPCARAVALSATGAGQALIFPYYTVRAAAPSGVPYTTLVTITNGSPAGKALKVRFREGRAGAQVFDFNLYLDSRDVWTGAIAQHGDGAVITTTDASCTLPKVAAPGSQQPSLFRGDRYAGDGAGDTLDRTREGWFEIVEMGTIPLGTPLADAIKLVAGVATCALPDSNSIVSQLDAPSGGLRGSVSIFNVQEGTSFGYDAVALDGWRTSATYSSPATDLPDLTSASPATSSVIDGGSLYISSWSTGADAVSAVLMASWLRADYSVEPSLAAATDVVVTLPTRHAYVNASQARAPFTDLWTPSGACEAYVDTQYDRERRLFWQNSSASPAFPSQALHLCWSATVQPMRYSLGPTRVGEAVSLLGSRNLARFIHEVPVFRYDGAVTPFWNGHTGVGFWVTHRVRQLVPIGATAVVDLRSGASSTRTIYYEGLPAVGIAFARYVNGTLVGGTGPVLSNYGTNGTVWYERRIVVQ